MQSRLDGSDVRTIVSTGLIEPGNAGLTVHTRYVVGRQLFIVGSLANYIISRTR